MCGKTRKLVFKDSEGRFLCDSCEKTHKQLLKAGVRSELDNSRKPIGYKIRNAETQKIPYMIICGQKESETGTVSLRKHGRKDLGTTTIKEIVKLVKTRTGIW